jgi:hypothetical protein
MNEVKEMNIYYFVQAKQAAQHVSTSVFEYQEEENKEANHAKIEQIVEEIFLGSQYLIGKKQAARAFPDHHIQQSQQKAMIKQKQQIDAVKWLSNRRDSIAVGTCKKALDRIESIEGYRMQIVKKGVTGQDKETDDDQKIIKYRRALWQDC